MAVFCGRQRKWVQEVIGIELQPDHVELAKANIHDLRGAKVITEDYLKAIFLFLGVST